jgi:hypothetical protein
MARKVIVWLTVCAGGAAAVFIAGSVLPRGSAPAEGPRLAILTDADTEEKEAPAASRPASPAAPAQPPAAGPRLDARSGAQLLAGVKVWVKRVRIGQDFDNRSWHQSTKYPLLKVTLGYQGVGLSREIKVTFDEETARASAVYPVYEDGRGKCPGVSWGLASTIHVRTNSRNEDTIYFEAPKSVRPLDLDYAPSFLPAGQAYRFRIPPEMIES